jgi:hypothetical protein
MDPNAVNSGNQIHACPRSHFVVLGPTANEVVVAPWLAITAWKSGSGRGQPTSDVESALQVTSTSPTVTRRAALLFQLSYALLRCSCPLIFLSARTDGVEACAGMVLNRKPNRRSAFRALATPIELVSRASRGSNINYFVCHLDTVHRPEYIRELFNTRQQ